MIDLPTLLADLSTHRPVFHSEADFQHALAWHLHKVFPEADVRLECQPVAGIHLDIWLRTNHGWLAIELKHATRLLLVDMPERTRSLAGSNPSAFVAPITCTGETIPRSPLNQAPSGMPWSMSNASLGVPSNPDRSFGQASTVVR